MGVLFLEDMEYEGIFIVEVMRGSEDIQGELIWALNPIKLRFKGRKIWFDLVSRDREYLGNLIIPMISNTSGV